LADASATVLVISQKEPAMPKTSSRRRRYQFASGLFLLIAAGCAAPPAHAQAAAAPPVPPGDARFWFYRVFFPDDTGDMPAISMNAAPIGYALSGTSFYRDAPAGQYHLTVATTGLDLYQSRDVAVAPGQQIYVKIASLPSWDESSQGRSRRGTYYVMIVAPQLAALELPETSYGGGS
jgi:hypothetical protein